VIVVGIRMALKPARFELEAAKHSLDALNSIQ
jgi:hypothetical protein